MSRPARALSTLAIGIYGKHDSRPAQPSPTPPSTKSRSGGIAGPNSPPAIARAYCTELKRESAIRECPQQQSTDAGSIPTKKRNLVEMNWDPITRIVGSLGIFTKIDFENKQVAECYSTSSIFRGYSIFMKGKDPRDAHFITSRICGICGDNHATCAVYAQNMAFGIKPPADWASGSSTSAKPPNTCSTTTSSRTTWWAWISASRW